MQKTLTLQIKPAGNYCNLDCTYCYASPFRGKKYSVLPLNIFEKIIKDAVKCSQNIILSWHGGEPTLPGVEYYKFVMKIINENKGSNTNVINMIQTNATLITEEFAQFFKDNNFIVSVSIDGDEDTHNRNRKDYKGIGSYEMVMKGVNNLRKVGINPPVIITVSKSTYNDCEHTFNSLVENGFTDIKFSPVYDSAEDEFSLSAKDWFEYLRKVFDIWVNMGNENIKVREIDIVLSVFSQDTVNLCNNTGGCVNWISIDEKGDMYPCEYMRYTNAYGNVLDMSIDEVFINEKYEEFKKEVLTRSDECVNCPLLKCCGNGCPATRIDNNGQLVRNGRYVYCSVQKSMFEYIKSILEET